jgi:TetR/AcrR family transcriptional regulator, tetracycline repressor protein
VPKAARRPSTRLDRDRVVRAALRIIDRSGAEGLTMRALGTELGVDPMATYHHVPGKAALLDAVVDAIWSELVLPPEHGRWQDDLRALAWALRDVLRAHPHALPLVATRQNTAGAGLAALDRAIGMLVAAGFRPAEAMRMVVGASAFVIGHALAEVGIAPGQVSDVPDEAFTAAATDPRGTYPHLEAAIDQGALDHGAMDETFETGLTLLISGAEHLLDRD